MDQRPTDRDDADADADGLVLEYPSADFPAPTPFRVRVPSGWHALAAPDAEMAIRRGEPVDGFRPNVLVNVHRLPRTGDPDGDLATLLASDAELPAMQILDDDGRRGGAAPARWRLLSYQGPGDIDLTARRVMILVEVSDHFVDVVSAIGTWPTGASAGIAAAVESVLASLKVGLVTEA